MSENKKIIVSACLAGIECRYDCQAKESADVIKLVQDGIAIPLCPEQLGGLPTPRTPAEQVGEKIIDKNGLDVTEQYNKGASEALKIVMMSGATEAILKSKSPMCGSGQIYDGTFSGTLINGDGVFAKLLKNLKIRIKTQ